MRYEDDFSALKQAGLDEINDQVQMAMAVYNKDPMQCCILFRYALEATLLTVYLLAGENPPDTNKKRINCLEKFILKKSLPNTVINEMHVLREKTNQYHHYPFKHNPEKDRLTCKRAMEPISEWIVDLSANPNQWHIQGKERGSILGSINAGLIADGASWIISHHSNKEEDYSDIRAYFKKRLLEMAEYDE